MSVYNANNINFNNFWSAKILTALPVTSPLAQRLNPTNNFSMNNLLAHPMGNFSADLNELLITSAYAPEVQIPNSVISEAADRIAALDNIPDSLKARALSNTSLAFKEPVRNEIGQVEFDAAQSIELHKEQSDAAPRSGWLGDYDSAVRKAKVFMPAAAIFTLGLQTPAAAMDASGILNTVISHPLLPILAGLVGIGVGVYALDRFARFVNTLYGNWRRGREGQNNHLVQIAKLFAEYAVWAGQSNNAAVDTEAIAARSSRRVRESAEYFGLVNSPQDPNQILNGIQETITNIIEEIPENSQEIEFAERVLEALMNDADNTQEERLNNARILIADYQSYIQAHFRRGNSSAEILILLQSASRLIEVLQAPDPQHSYRIRLLRGAMSNLFVAANNLLLRPRSYPRNKFLMALTVITPAVMVFTTWFRWYILKLPKYDLASKIMADALFAAVMTFNAVTLVNCFNIFYALFKTGRYQANGLSWVPKNHQQVSTETKKKPKGVYLLPTFNEATRIVKEAMRDGMRTLLHYGRMGIAHSNDSNSMYHHFAALGINRYGQEMMTREELLHRINTGILGAGRDSIAERIAVFMAEDESELHHYGMSDARGGARRLAFQRAVEDIIRPLITDNKNVIALGQAIATNISMRNIPAGTRITADFIRTEATRLGIEPEKAKAAAEPILRRLTELMRETNIVRLSRLLLSLRVPRQEAIDEAIEYARREENVIADLTPAHTTAINITINGPRAEHAAILAILLERQFNISRQEAAAIVQNAINNRDTIDNIIRMTSGTPSTTGRANLSRGEWEFFAHPPHRQILHRAYNLYARFQYFDESSLGITKNLEDLIAEVVEQTVYIDQDARSFGKNMERRSGMNTFHSLARRRATLVARALTKYIQAQPTVQAEIETMLSDAQFQTQYSGLKAKERYMTADTLVWQSRTDRIAAEVRTACQNNGISTRPYQRNGISTSDTENVVNVIILELSNEKAERDLGAFDFVQAMASDIDGIYWLFNNIPASIQAGICSNDIQVRNQAKRDLITWMRRADRVSLELTATDGAIPDLFITMVSGKQTLANINNLPQTIAGIWRSAKIIDDKKVNKITKIAGQATADAIHNELASIIRETHNLYVTRTFCSVRDYFLNTILTINFNNQNSTISIGNQDIEEISRWCSERIKLLHQIKEMKGDWGSGKGAQMNNSLFGSTMKQMLAEQIRQVIFERAETYIDIKGDVRRRAYIPIEIINMLDDWEILNHIEMPQDARFTHAEWVAQHIVQRLEENLSPDKITDEMLALWNLPADHAVRERVLYIVRAMVLRLALYRAQQLIIREVDLGVTMGIPPGSSIEEHTRNVINSLRGTNNVIDRFLHGGVTEENILRQLMGRYPNLALDEKEELRLKDEIKKLINGLISQRFRIVRDDDPADRFILADQETLHLMINPEGNSLLRSAWIKLLDNGMSEATVKDLAAYIDNLVQIPPGNTRDADEAERIIGEWEKVPAADRIGGAPVIRPFIRPWVRDRLIDIMRLRRELSAATDPAEKNKLTADIRNTTIELANWMRQEPNFLENNINRITMIGTGDAAQPLPKLRSEVIRFLTQNTATIDLVIDTLIANQGLPHMDKEGAYRTLFDTVTTVINPFGYRGYNYLEETEPIVDMTYDFYLTADKDWWMNPESAEEFAEDHLNHPSPFVFAKGQLNRDMDHRLSMAMQYGGDAYWNFQMISYSIGQALGPWGPTSSYNVKAMKEGKWLTFEKYDDHFNLRKYLKDKTSTPAEKFLEPTTFPLALWKTVYKLFDQLVVAVPEFLFKALILKPFVEIPHEWAKRSPNSRVLTFLLSNRLTKPFFKGFIQMRMHDAKKSLAEFMGAWDATTESEDVATGVIKQQVTRDLLPRGMGFNNRWIRWVQRALFTNPVGRRLNTWGWNALDKLIPRQSFWGIIFSSPPTKRWNALRKGVFKPGKGATGLFEGTDIEQTVTYGMRWLRGNLQQFGPFLRAKLSPMQKLAFLTVSGFWSLALIRPFTLLAPAFYFLGGLKLMAVGDIPLSLTALPFLAGPYGWLSVFLLATFIDFILGMGVFLLSMRRQNRTWWQATQAMAPDHGNIIQSATSAYQAITGGREAFTTSAKKGIFRSVPARQKRVALAYPVINALCVLSAFHRFLSIPGFNIGIIFAAFWPLINYLLTGPLNKYMQGDGVSPKTSYWEDGYNFWFKSHRQPQANPVNHTGNRF